MSSRYSTPITADGEQEKLLRIIATCVHGISVITKGTLEEAIKDYQKVTHRSPLLSILGPAGIAELEARLEISLREMTKQGNKQTQDWLNDCLSDIKAYKKAKEELDEAETRVEFYTLQSQKAEELFIYTIMYKKKKEEAEKDGGVYLFEYDTWLDTQPTVKLDLDSKDEWLDWRREEKGAKRNEDVSEEQWDLVDAIVDALKGKRIRDGGDAAVLGL